MGLRMHIADIRPIKYVGGEFGHRDLKEVLEDILEDNYVNICVEQNRSGESDFERWEIEKDDLRRFVKGVKSGEITLEKSDGDDDFNWFDKKVIVPYLEKAIKSSRGRDVATFEWF